MFINCRITCTEISGVPSLPDGLILKGQIEVAIVLPVPNLEFPGNGIPRLMIVATEGTKVLSIHEVIFFLDNKFLNNK